MAGSLILFCFRRKNNTQKHIYTMFGAWFTFFNTNTCTEHRMAKGWFRWRNALSTYWIEHEGKNERTIMKRWVSWETRRHKERIDGKKNEKERIKSLSHTDTINEPTTHNALAAFWVVCSFVLFLFAANMHVLFTMDQSTITLWAGPWCEHRVTIHKRGCFKKQSAFYSIRPAKRMSVLLLWSCEHTNSSLFFHCNRKRRLKHAHTQKMWEKKNNDEIKSIVCDDLIHIVSKQWNYHVRMCNKKKKETDHWHFAWPLSAKYSRLLR